MPTEGRTRNPAATRLLVAWYGMFPGNGTIGDLLSVRAVTDFLLKNGYSVHTASAEPYAGLGETRVDWASVSPDRFDAVVFVCGPIARSHPLLPGFFSRFHACRKIGVGVSIFPAIHFNFFDPFDVVLAREGKPERFEDVALACASANSIPKKEPRDRNVTIGICLRGQQGEYGVENCLHRKTKSMALEAAEKILAERGGRISLIDNHLKRSGIAPDQIVAKYAECDLLITSRYHGAMLAIGQQVPFIAIDQISGGAKLSSLLKDKPWPHLYKADRIDARTVFAGANDIFDRSRANEMPRIREEGVRAALRTLGRLELALRKPVG